MQFALIYPCFGGAERARFDAASLQAVLIARGSALAVRKHPANPSVN